MTSLAAAHSKPLEPGSRKSGSMRERTLQSFLPETRPIYKVNVKCLSKRDKSWQTNFRSASLRHLSAKEGKNVDETFYMLTRQIRSNIAATAELGNDQRLPCPEGDKHRLSLGSTNKKKQKKGCC